MKCDYCERRIKKNEGVLYLALYFKGSKKVLGVACGWTCLNLLASSKETTEKEEVWKEKINNRKKKI